MNRARNKRRRGLDIISIRIIIALKAFEFEEAELKGRKERTVRVRVSWMT